MADVRDETADEEEMTLEETRDDFDELKEGVPEKSLSEEIEERIKKKKNVDLEKLVTQPTWKEMLLDLIVSEELDPWNIDIVKVTEKYVDRIKKMQTLDLHVPANLVLAASILLRFKSDTIKLDEEEQVVEQETFLEENSVPVEIPMLSIKTRIPPQRKITLDDLVMALKDVMSDQLRREAIRNRPIVREEMKLELPKFDLEKKMKELYETMKALKDEKELVMFSQLLEKRTRQQIIYTLIPLLHLAQAKKIYLFQEKFFGEIFIQVLKEEEHGKQRRKK